MGVLRESVVRRDPGAEDGRGRTSAKGRKASGVALGVGGVSTWRIGEVSAPEALAPGLQARPANRSPYVMKEEAPTKETTTMVMDKRSTAVTERRICVELI